MFEGELWKNFCNYFKSFKWFNCYDKIPMSVIRKQQGMNRQS